MKNMKRSTLIYFIFLLATVVSSFCFGKTGSFSWESHCFNDYCMLVGFVSAGTTQGVETASLTVRFDDRKDRVLSMQISYPGKADYSGANGKHFIARFTSDNKTTLDIAGLIEGCERDLFCKTTEIYEGSPALNGMGLKTLLLDSKTITFSYPSGGETQSISAPLDSFKEKYEIYVKRAALAGERLLAAKPEAEGMSIRIPLKKGNYWIYKDAVGGDTYRYLVTKKKKFKGEDWFRIDEGDEDEFWGHNWYANRQDGYYILGASDLDAESYAEKMYFFRSPARNGDVYIGLDDGRVLKPSIIDIRTNVEVITPAGKFTVAAFKIGGDGRGDVDYFKTYYVDPIIGIVKITHGKQSVGSAYIQDEDLQLIEYRVR